MRIDGREIATNILFKLQKKVEKLKEKKIVPKLAIILVGDDPASTAYVRQKELKSKIIGATALIYHLPKTISFEELLKLIKKLNNDSSVDGIVVQQPLPAQIDPSEIVKKVDPKKDVDGLNSKSRYPMPLASAVIEILEEIYKISNLKNLTLNNWLNSKSIVVLGKGETGGGPVIKELKKRGAKPEIIDSKTKNPQNLIKKADIVISAVGKINLIKPEMIKKGSILIGIGMQRGKDGKLHADYEENLIENITSFYTPVPGGVGPVNVAMLLENVVKAAEGTI